MSNPWYKRIFRWDKPAIKWVILTFLVTFGVAVCHESRADGSMRDLIPPRDTEPHSEFYPYASVSAGISKFKASHAGVSLWTADRRWMYDLTYIGREDRRKFENRSVATFSFMHWAGFGDKHRLELGLGGSYSTMETISQGSRLNFALGVGYAYVTPTYFVSLHEMHWSNAGLKRPNSGRDIVRVTFGRRIGQ